jgi:predicted phage terminase large subunit-like protein
MRYSVTVRGQLTGEHADTMIVDDPIDPLGAALVSGVELDEVLNWWHFTVPTRFRDHTRSARVVIMQRLHLRDLSAEMIRTGAHVLCLPMRYESRHPQRWSRDPRTADGGLLVPARIPEDELQRIERQLGPMQTAAQQQQRPVPAEGGVFKKDWFKFWTVLPPGGTWMQSWDCTFKDANDSDFVVGQVWYQHGANFYLVDQVRERMSFSRTIEQMLALSARYPRTFKKLVENKANGPAVADVLERDIPGITLIEPEGGKIARANAVEPLVAAGNVFLPDPRNAEYPDGRRGAPWVDTDPHGEPNGSFLAEITTFPNAAHDDQVDALTQFLNHAAPAIGERMKAAMNRLFARR